VLRVNRPQIGRVGKLVAIVLILIIAPVAFFAIGSRAKAKTRTFPFAAAADSYVSAAHRSHLFGAAPSLRTAGKVAWSYLRFDLTGVVGNVSKTTLRVYVRSANRLGFVVNRVQTTAWDERTLSYANAPPVGPVLGRSGPIRSKQWVTVDLLLPADRDGPITLALTAARYSTGWYASRESGATAPQLVVQTVIRRAGPSASPLRPTSDVSCSGDLLGPCHVAPGQDGPDPAQRATFPAGGFRRLGIRQVTSAQTGV
jgi:acid phosphatase type 7